MLEVFLFCALFLIQGLSLNPELTSWFDWLPRGTVIHWFPLPPPDTGVTDTGHHGVTEAEHHGECGTPWGYRCGTSWGEDVGHGITDAGHHGVTDVGHHV